MVKVASVEPPLAGCALVREYLSKYSGWDVDTMTAISQAESNCNPDDTGDVNIEYQLSGRTYGYSVGAMQIRILPGRENCDTHDLATNVLCAYTIWQRAGYKAWSTYNNGRYKSFL